MTTWSTDHLPRRDRFEYWREERARRMFGVEAEMEPAQRLEFSGRLTALAVGPATVLRIQAQSYTLHRTRRLIDRSPDGAFYIRQVERGSVLLTVGDGTEQVSTGAVTTSLSDVPFTNRPGPDQMRDPVTYRAIKIPTDLLPEGAREGLSVRKHQGGHGLDTLFRTYLAAFVAQAPHLAGPAAEQAVRTLAQLAVAARGAAEPEPDAVRQGLLTRAHRLIERDLHRGDLTPARTARELGISVRRLHLLFEPTGETFARRVLTRRLARADRMLAGSPDLSVTEVAYASGFDSLSTFFRCYRAAFGDSPGGRRAALGCANGSGPIAPA